MKRKVSVIMPVFNGKELLAEHLPELLDVLGREDRPYEHEVIIVDDGSTDGSAAFVRETFPGVRVVALEKNAGFARACNAGVEKASGEVVYFLNSDVKVTGGFLDPLMPYFDRQDVFAVSSVEADPRTGLVTRFTVPLVKFKRGIFWYWYQDAPIPASGVEVFCVSGGHAAFDRRKFLELGGFDALFRPFYAEDGDVCWRAWKRGWKSVLEPRSFVIHQCKGTIGRFYAPFDIRAIHWKNRFLLTWKDIIQPQYVVSHLLYLLPELCLLPLLGKGEFTVGFWNALHQLPELLKSRAAALDKKPVYTDRELFRRFSVLESAGQEAGAAKGCL